MRAIAEIDRWASAGRTVWHRASALAKLVLAAGVLALTLAAPGAPLLLALHATAWVLAITSRLPWPVLLAAASYPLLFTGLFALAAWGGGPALVLPVVLRPLTASLIAVWLVGTTPYPDLFAPVSRVLPRAVGDGLFLTYRALFELLGRVERLARALRMRGGVQGSPRRRMAVLGEGLGTLVLYGFERSQRTYATLLLRGHSGRICGCRHYAELTRADAVVALALGVVAAAAAALWRRA